MVFEKCPEFLKNFYLQDTVNIVEFSGYVQVQYGSMEVLWPKA
jgi:hypothetical protein